MMVRVSEVSWRRRIQTRVFYMPEGSDEYDPEVMTKWEWRKIEEPID